MHHVTAGELGLRSGMVPPWMANPSISGLCRPSVWASAGSHFLQQIFQTVGSIDSAVLPSFDFSVLWRRHNYRCSFSQGFRPMGNEPIMFDDWTPVRRSPKTRSRPCRVRALSWDWPMTSVTSTKQAMLSFGHVIGSMTKFVTFWPQHVKQATSVEAQPPSPMVWPTSWNKAFMAVWDMAVLWRQGTSGREYHPHHLGDWSLLRGDRSCDALSAKTWISSFSYGKPSIFGSIRCGSRSRQSRIRWLPPHIFPTWRFTNPSQFCCNQLCRASVLMAACGDPHRSVGALYGFVCPGRAPRPFPTSTWPLVSWQRRRSHDLSERAL